MTSAEQQQSVENAIAAEAEFSVGAACAVNPALAADAELTADPDADLAVRAGAASVDATALQHPAEAPRCANCACIADGRYCPACGQRQRAPDLSVRGLVREFAFELLNADGRLHRTALSLLAHPGQFALDYFEGRRDRHLPPVRTYIITTVLLFLVLGAFGGPPELNEIAAADRPAANALAINTGHPQFDAAMNIRLNTQLAHFLDEPQRLFEAMREMAPQLGFFVIPPTALVLMLLFNRRDYRYGHHLIAVLCLQASAFSLMIGAAILLGLAGLAQLTGAALLGSVLEAPLQLLPLFALVQLGIGVQRIYGRRWPATLTRLFVAGVFYALFLLIAFVLTLIVAFLSF